MILIGLGSNLGGSFGSCESVIFSALDALRAHGIEVRGVSRLWLTQPVPVSDQPWYHNAVAHVQTRLSAPALLTVLLSIEANFGRVRGDDRNAARIVDLDLLAYGDLVLNHVDLILPHPRMRARAFVLYPLRDIVPDWNHPVTGESLEAMIADLSPQTLYPLQCAAERHGEDLRHASTHCA